jgi:hypothetical protein
MTTFENIFLAAEPLLQQGSRRYFKFDEVDVFFKIDYFDKSLRVHSPNPADPAVTERVITIMRADEY